MTTAEQIRNAAVDVLGDSAVVEVEQLEGESTSISMLVEFGPGIAPAAVARFKQSIAEILAPYPGATFEIIEPIA
jgi:hypothetical protein